MEFPVISTKYGITSLVMISGGTGFVVGTLYSLVEGTGMKNVVLVTSIGTNGVITGFTFLRGFFDTNITGAVTISSGSGTATFNAALSLGAQVACSDFNNTLITR